MLEWEAESYRQDNVDMETAQSEAYLNAHSSYLDAQEHIQARATCAASGAASDFLDLSLIHI